MEEWAPPNTAPAQPQLLAYGVVSQGLPSEDHVALPAWVQTWRIAARSACLPSAACSNLIVRYRRCSWAMLAGAAAERRPQADSETNIERCVVISEGDKNEVKRRSEPPSIAYVSAKGLLARCNDVATIV